MKKALLFFVFMSAAVCFGGTVTTAANSTNAQKNDSASEREEVPPQKPKQSANFERNANNQGGTANTPGLATSESTVSNPSASQLWGGIDLRPGYTSDGHGNRYFDTENTAELGWKPNPDRLIGYTQYFNTNLSDPSHYSGNPGMGLVASDGFFRFKMKNLWQSQDKTWSFTYEPRLYTPTDPGLRGHGLIAYTRQYLIFSKKISDQVTLSFMDIPFYYGFNRAGYVSKDTAFGNPVFENREYVVLDISLAKGFIDVSIPLLVNHQWTRDNSTPGFKTDPKNGRVSHTLWTWPEIDFNVAPHTAIGVAWESDNFVKPDFSAFDFDNAVKNSTLQLVMRASL